LTTADFKAMLLYAEHQLNEQGGSMKKYSVSIFITSLLATSWLCFAQAQQEQKQNKPATAHQSQSSSTNKALQEKIIVLEKQVVEALKKKDWNTFDSLLAEDCVVVGGDGVQRKPEMLQDLKANYSLSDFSMTDVNVVAVNKDTALIAYKAMGKGSYKGEDWSEQAYGSSVWAKRGGKWLTVLHQETPVKQQTSTGSSTK
jgi:hypothetical protein